MNEHDFYSDEDDESSFVDYIIYPDESMSVLEQRQSMIKRKMNALLLESCQISQKLPTERVQDLPENTCIDAKFFLKELKRYKDMLKSVSAGAAAYEESLKTTIASLHEQTARQESELGEYKKNADTKFERAVNLMCKWKKAALHFQQKSQVLKQTVANQQREIERLTKEVQQGKALCLDMFKELNKVSK